MDGLLQAPVKAFAQSLKIKAGENSPQKSERLDNEKPGLGSKFSKLQQATNKIQQQERI